jgi:hypothetical protein
MVLHGDALVVVLSFLPAGQLLTCMMRVNTAWRRLLMTRPDAWGQRLIELKTGLPRQLPAYPWYQIAQVQIIRTYNPKARVVIDKLPFAVRSYQAFGKHRKLRLVRIIACGPNRNSFASHHIYHINLEK